jgi:hypothetical protein
MKRYTLKGIAERGEMAERFHDQIDLLANAPKAAQIGQLSVSTLFLQFLADTIDAELNGHSIGCSWLQRENNAKLFVQQCTDVTGFFYRLQSRESARTVLASAVLLGGVPHDERETFILNMLRKGDLHYQPWHRWALEAGTHQKTVAKVVLAMLRESERPLLDHDCPQHYSFVQDFSYSYGGLGYVSDHEELPDASKHKIYVDQPNMWSIMTDDQLLEAAETCEFHCPGILFENSRAWCIYWALEAYLVGIQRSQSDRRYNRQRLNALLLQSCTNARDLSGMLSSIFVDLPLQAQLELIDKHDGINYDVLVSTALRLDNRAMFDRYFAKVQDCNPSWAHGYTQRVCAEHPGDLGQHILQQMEAWIDSVGYKLAPASLDNNNSPFVVLDGVRYVTKDSPKIREQAVVIFNTNGTVVSESPRTVETFFWPV